MRESILQKPFSIESYQRIEFVHLLLRLHRTFSKLNIKSLNSAQTSDGILPTRASRLLIFLGNKRVGC